MNPDLQAAHSMLGAVIAALSQRIGQTSNPKQAQALQFEMNECLHRLNMIQQVLFVQMNNEIATQAALVQTAGSEIQSVIAQIGQIATVVNGITSFLGQVDNLIDIAKKFAVL